MCHPAFYRTATLYPTKWHGVSRVINWRIQRSLQRRVRSNNPPSHSDSYPPSHPRDSNFNCTFPLTANLHCFISPSCFLLARQAQLVLIGSCPVSSLAILSNDQLLRKVTNYTRRERLWYTETPLDSHPSAVSTDSPCVLTNCPLTSSAR